MESAPAWSASWNRSVRCSNERERSHGSQNQWYLQVGQLLETVHYVALDQQEEHVELPRVGYDLRLLHDPQPRRVDRVIQPMQDHDLLREGQLHQRCTDHPLTPSLALVAQPDEQLEQLDELLPGVGPLEIRLLPLLYNLTPVDRNPVTRRGFLFISN